MATPGMMKFDGKAIFGYGSHHLEVGSWRREHVDRGFCGLDGVLSFDLGRRERHFRQWGNLLSPNREGLQSLVSNINNYLDGQVYELTDDHETVYSNVRMDSFELTKSIYSESPARCEYEIQYTQLSV